MAKAIRIKRDFSCGGLVWDPDQEKVIMIQVKNLKKTKVWTFPKGHPEGQETDEATALREVQEETGWKCEIVNPLMDVHYSYVDKNVKYNKTVRWFLMHPIEEVGTHDTVEVLALKWIDLSEAKKLIVYESDEKLLKRLALLT
jgi:bis(5'-nucleosidyl)-tetraphosphatase